MWWFGVYWNNVPLSCHHQCLYGSVMLVCQQWNSITHTCSSIYSVPSTVIIPDWVVSTVADLYRIMTLFNDTKCRLFDILIIPTWICQIGFPYVFDELGATYILLGKTLNRDACISVGLANKYTTSQEPENVKYSCRNIPLGLDTQLSIQINCIICIVIRPRGAVYIIICLKFDKLKFGDWWPHYVTLWQQRLRMGIFDVIGLNQLIEF